MATFEEEKLRRQFAPKDLLSAKVSEFKPIETGSLLISNITAETSPFYFTAQIFVDEITSGSVSINGIEFFQTSSATLPPNTPTRIYYGSEGANNNNFANAFNASASLSTYSSSLGNITASSLFLYQKTPTSEQYPIQRLLPTTNSVTYLSSIMGWG